MPLLFPMVILPISPFVAGQKLPTKLCKKTQKKPKK
jgi:hypothetical protein